MTRKRRLAFSFLLLIWLGSTCFSAEILVSLDATKLMPGPLAAWPNLGSLGGSFNAAKALPVVEMVAGRMAVTFKGQADFLKSTFAVPEPLGGNHSFSAVAWVYDPQSDRKKTILSWASKPKNSAEFSIGNGRDAAFLSAGSIKAGYDGGVPADKTWQHLAITFDGSVLKVYLNGELNVEKSCALNIKNGEPIIVGAAWDSGKNVPVTLFSGSLAKLRLYDDALSALDIRNLIGLTAAFHPSPKNGETIENLSVSLQWEAGAKHLDSFEIYFSADRSEIESAGKSSRAFQDSLPPNSHFWKTPGLSLGGTYFWRVDQIGKAGKAISRGETWSFTVSACPASRPFPRDKITAVKADLTELRWTPNRYAVSQDVYFGDSQDQVQKATTPQIKGLSAAANGCRIPRLPLEQGKKYFWRVDTNNGKLTPAKGDIWSFRVEDKPESGDITFFLVSDTHYGASVTIANADRMMVDVMNNFPGALYPKSVGDGIVKTPRGVLVLGDLVDEGEAEDAAEIFRSFAEDYGINGEGRLVYPVYEGAGNHDGGARDPVRMGIVARNAIRPAVKNVSSNGLHYSWDWDQVHFVQLNLFPGTVGDDIVNPWSRHFEGDWKYPQHSLEFLIDDLARNVGLSGRPVVLVQHYGWDDWGKGWWSERERSAYYDAIKNYNIIAIFWGHSHMPQYFNWNGVPTWCVGSPQIDPAPGEFFVVHITPNEMVVAEREHDRWGLTARIDLKAGKQDRAYFSIHLWTIPVEAPAAGFFGSTLFQSGGSTPSRLWTKKSLRFRSP
jgi:hypothetical protein